MKASNRACFLSLASLFFIAGAFIPFITNTSLPLFLKSVHGLEILADSLVYAGILTYLFRVSLHFRRTASQSINLLKRTDKTRLTVMSTRRQLASFTYHH